MAIAPSAERRKNTRKTETEMIIIHIAKNVKKRENRPILTKNDDISHIFVKKLLKNK